MPYSYILDDSIKLSPTLILTADHSTLLFLPGVFYKMKNLFFLLSVNLYMNTDTYLHDPPPFNGLFFTTPPFSAVSKSCDPFVSHKFLVSPSLCFHPPPPPANFWHVPKKEEESKKQHQDLMQVMLQETKQQQERMQKFQQMFTLMQQQQSQIIIKLLEKQN